MLDDIVLCKCTEIVPSVKGTVCGNVVSRDLSSPPECSVKHHLGRMRIKAAIESA